MATGQDRNFQIDELFPAINGTRANITRPIVGGGSRVRAAGLIKGNRSGLSDKTRWKGPAFLLPIQNSRQGVAHRYMYEMGDGRKQSSNFRFEFEEGGGDVWMNFWKERLIVSLSSTKRGFPRGINF